MKKIILIGFVLLSINLVSQTKNGFYITNANDTINCLFVTPKTFFGNKLDVSALYGPITVIENGVKKKFKHHEIKSFTLYDTKDIKYKFGSFKDEKRCFVNILVEGRLSLCNVYSTNSYDHSFSPIQALVKDEKMYRLNIFNIRRIIGELISDCPELNKDWLEGQKYKTKDLEVIVKVYNTCMIHQ